MLWLCPMAWSGELAVRKVLPPVAMALSVIVLKNSVIVLKNSLRTQ